jgi:methionyl-tRNA formyltransferase
MERERNLRIVLFTVRPDNVPLTEEWLGKRGHRVVGVLTAPGPRSRQTDGYLGVAQHARPGLDVIISNYPNRWADMIRPMRPDLIVCAAFNWKIPADVLQVPRLGAINGHDALLPRYRGRNATGWALRNDEPEFGLTMHRMTPALDDGPILAQRRIPITDQDDIDSLFPRLGNAAESAFEEAVERIEVHDPGIPQDESQVTYAGGAFEPEWRQIDWNNPARNIFLQIRSWWGSRDVPRGAFAVIDGQRALITKAWCSEQPSNGAAPGTVLDRRDDGSLLVQCADGPLEIVQWTIEEQT